MKKIIATTTLLTLLAGASAFAKTEGSYLGLDLHRATVTSHTNQKTDGTNDPSSFGYYQQQTKTGLGVSYKYAFNFDKFFVAPGLFYERIGTKVTTQGGEPPYIPSFSVNNRYGVRADFGYDITDTFAAYLTAGLSNTGYKVLLADGHSGPNDSYGIQTQKNKTALLFGAGFISKINDQYSLGFEFNTQRLDVKNNDQTSNVHTKATLDMYKVTLAYHF